MSISSNDHWTGLAKRWNWIGSPLRPIKQDIDIMTRMIGAVPEKALLLGVTPELADLANKVVAVDKNEAMIAECWSSGNNPAICGDWRNLSEYLVAEKFDYILGDCSLNCVPYLDGIKEVFNELNKVTNIGAQFVFRAFLSPSNPEIVEDIIQEAKEGEMKNFHAFRWRIAHAIAAENSNPNVRMQELYSQFNKFVKDRTKFAEQSGFDIESINRLDVYKDSDFSLAFPTMEQLVASIPTNWEVIDTDSGNYELADRCPILKLVKI